MRARPFGMLLIGAAVSVMACGESRESRCESASDCSGESPVCDVGDGTCVECLAARDCSAGEICADEACVAPEECTSSRQCPGLVCDLAEGRCAECVTDTDCGATERCDGAGVCQPRPPACASDRQCSELGLVCDPEAGECVECVADTDCDSGLRCVARACRPEALPDDAGPGDAGAGDAGLGDVDAGAPADGGVPDGGQTCDEACLCDRAAAAGSTQGCEFWPVVTPHSDLAEAFSFGVLVSNPQSAAAEVSVSRAGTVIATRTVPAGASDVIVLPRIPELELRDARTSVRLLDGAYRLASTVPVASSQAFALEPAIGEMSSFSSDASLLLPTHALGTSYRVVSRATRVIRQTALGGAVSWSGGPGFATVVAVEPSTVTITSTAHVTASAGETVQAMAPGESISYSLARGEVLTLATLRVNACPPGAPTDDLGVSGSFAYCDQGPDYDLTGTRITSTGRIQVIGGHVCAFVPFDRWACDHLESSVLPEPSAGRRYVVARSVPRTDEPDVVRVMSLADGNTITFAPATVSEPLVLDAGEWRELLVHEDVEIAGSAALLVTQLLVGDRYDGFATTPAGGGGDPSMAVLLPSSSGVEEHTFHALAGFLSHVNVVAPAGASVSIDGTPITDWRTLTGTSLRTARVQLGAGVHRLQGSADITGVLYGTASFTSYMLPLGGEL